MGASHESYDVALSYAGEQREYVRRVAEALQNSDVKVFFDDFEEVALWGHDLAVHFETVFRTAARYVVPFVSKDYASKAWPRLEFQSALARAVEAKTTYILPVRFDQTDLPGLRPTIRYLDATKLSPEEVAQRIIERLGRSSSAVAKADAVAPARMPGLPPSNFNPFLEAERAVAILQADLTSRAKALEAHGFGVHAQKRNERFMLRVMRGGQVMYSLDVWIGGDWGDNTICFAVGAGGHTSPGGINASGVIEWDRRRAQPIVKVANFSLLSEMGRDYRLTPEELADEIWNELCRRLESSE